VAYLVSGAMGHMLVGFGYVFFIILA